MIDEEKIIDKFYSNIEHKCILTEKYKNNLIFDTNLNNNFSGANLFCFYYIDNRYGDSKKIYLNNINSFFKQTLKEKYNKMLKFWNSVIKDMKTEIKTEYPERIYYYKSDYECYYFVQDKKNKEFWINYDKIWSVFRNEFGFNYTDTKMVTKSLVCKTYKLRGYTTSSAHIYIRSKVCKTYKLRGYTTFKSYMMILGV